MPCKRRCSFLRSEELPDLWTTALDEIFAVGVVVDPKVDHLFGPIAATVPLDEAIDRRLDLKLPLGAVFDGQVEEQMAMHHLGLATRHALTRPSRREHDALPPQPLVQTLAEFREELAVGIITHIGVGPMDRQMGHQGEADGFGVFDRLDDVGGLRDSDVFGAARAVLPSMFRLLVRLRCVSA